MFRSDRRLLDGEDDGEKLRMSVDTSERVKGQERVNLPLSQCPQSVRAPENSPLIVTPV